MYRTPLVAALGFESLSLTHRVKNSTTTSVALIGFIAVKSLALTGVT